MSSGKGHPACEATGAASCRQRLVRALRRVKHRKARAHCAETCLWVLLLVPALTLAALGVDALLALSPEARLTLIVAGAAAVAGVTLWRGAVPLIRTFCLSRGRLAHRIEAYFPDLESRLVTVLDLPEAGPGDGAFARQMTTLAVRSAAREIDRTDLTRMVSLRVVKRQLQALLVVAVAVAAITAADPDGVLAGLGRFANIAHEMRLARATVTLRARVVESDTVHVLSGQAEPVAAAAIAGSDVTLSVDAASSVPAPLKLHRRGAGEESFSVTTMSADRDAVTLKNVAEDTELYLSLGPEKTPLVTIEATDYPRIETVQVRYRFPRYTRMKPEFIPACDGNLRVLHMTEAEVTVVADKPLGSAVFEVYGKRVAARTHGRRATTRFLVTDDGAYALELTDRHRFAIQDDFRRSIESIPDRPPEVTVDSPDELLLTAEQARGVAVNLEAKDDYGAAAVRLMYEVSKLEDIRVDKQRDPGLRRKEHLLSSPRRLVKMEFPCGFGGLNLQVGEVVTYWIEVADADNETGPKVARSRKLRLVVVAEELKTWSEIEDEDRWPVSFRGLLADKQKGSGGIRGLRPKLVEMPGEKPRAVGEGVSDIAEGHIPQRFREGFSGYSSAVKANR
ncbi:MAG: DUF4175 family protein [Planctomycetota bacterium]